MALVKCEEEDIRAIAEAIRLNPNFTNTYTIGEMPDAIQKCIEDYQKTLGYLIEGKRNLIENIKLPNTLTTIRENAFYECTCLSSVTFKGTPRSINSRTFYDCTNLKTINVPWSKGAVSGAPWGATNATINYNYKGL